MPFDHFACKGTHIALEPFNVIRINFKRCFDFYVFMF